MSWRLKQCGTVSSEGLAILFLKNKRRHTKNTTICLHLEKKQVSATTTTHSKANKLVLFPFILLSFLLFIIFPFLFSLIFISGHLLTIFSKEKRSLLGSMAVILTKIDYFFQVLFLYLEDELLFVITVSKYVNIMFISCYISMLFINFFFFLFQMSFMPHHSSLLQG